MGVATASSGSSTLYQYSVPNNNTSMSQSYQHLQQAGGIFSFPPNGLDRSAVGGQEEEDHHQNHRYHQQIRHKHNQHFRIQQQEAAPATGFELPNSTDSQQLLSTVAAGTVMDDPTGGALPPSAAAAVYESAAAAGGGGMLSEMMFNFGVGDSSSNNEQQHHLLHHNHHQINSGNHESAAAAAAMQLFLINPHHHHEQQRPGSPTSHPVAGAASPVSITNSSAAALAHMFAPNHQSHPVAGAAGNSNNNIHTFLSSINQNSPQFTWINRQGDDDTATTTNTNSTPTGMGIGVGAGVHQGQGLSLSLSSSLEAAKAEHHRHHLVRNIGGTEMMFFGNNDNNNINQASSSTDHNSNFKDFGILGRRQQQQQQHMMLQHHHHLQLQQAVGAGGALTAHQPSVPVHLGLLGPSSPTISPSTNSLAVVNVLRNSKYSRPAQELLEEFCSIGRGGHLTVKNKGNNKLARNTSSLSNNNASNSGGAADPSPSTSNSPAAAKDNVPPLSPADRMEHQRRKVKLISMLDEVERRYSHYCEQMHGVVNSFDLVMGFGAATPYTALAQKAMSRHFRCLKNAIQAQLKHSCELLGEKDITGSSGLSKGETPRLKILEQSLRHQRAFHQMGMMDQEAWRPQRGLPERSVNVLRSWLFEHFLHPYPNDADKHLLARQTGLSRNQVSNWFINARVRLWKPMVEEMYQQEDKEREEENERQPKQSNQHEQIAQTSSSALLNLPPAATTTTVTALTSSTTTAPPKGKTTTDAEVAAGVTDQGGDGYPSSFMHSADGMVNAHNMMMITRHNMDNDYGDSMVGVGSGAFGSAAHHLYHHHQSSAASGSGGGGAGMGPLHVIKFGTTGGPTSGDVSLTLGLRHGAVGGGGTAQDNDNALSFRDFGS